MLERLELNYFKKHEHLVVDFTPGLNGIVGPNYRGKTTVIYGILYCLGGARMVPGTRMQTRGTNSGFRQILTLGIAGKGRYRIERTKTGASLTELCEDGTEQSVATGTSPVNAAVARLIGMPLKRFAQIKYARQRSASSILQAGSTELFKIITELTGLERVGKVLERTGAQLKSWRSIQDTAPYTDLAEQQAKVAAWLAEEAQLAEQISGLVDQQETLKAARAVASGVERQLSGAQTVIYSANAALRNAEQELLHARAELDTFLQRRAAFTGEPKTDDELQALEDQVTQLRQAAHAAKSARNQVQQIQSELTAEQTNLEEAQAAAAPLRQRLADLRVVDGGPDLLVLRDQAAQAKAAYLVQADKHRALVEAGKSGVCDGCQRPFEAFDPFEHAEHVAEALGLLQELQAEAQRCAAALQDEEDFREQLQAAQTAVDKAESRLHALQQSCQRLDEQLRQAVETSLAAPPVDQAEQQLQAMLTVLTEGRRDAQRIAALDHSAGEAQRLVSLRIELRDQAAAELKSLRAAHQVDSIDLGNALQAARDQVDQHDAHLRRLSEGLSALRNQAQSAHTARTQVERGMAAAAERNQQHQHAAKQVVLLTELLDYIRNNRDRYSKQVWDVFMASASLFASDATGGVIESISRDEGGDFAFIEEGYEMEQAEASGAQLAILGTAVQLALADAALSPLNLVLMDEPTADMDPERALAFSTLLAGSGKQVVMVTHRELDSTVFDNTVEL